MTSGSIGALLAAAGETKEFSHPVLGPLVLRRHSLTVGETDGQVVIAYQAEPGTPSAAALARLTAPAPDHDGTFRST
ncbi:hypothetical protein [Microbispora sp. CA-102843]|uniref:MmyB family transcriptional regulator n=1 Tax=Microbispora sp. CA-102843 TaxID=3239952 RepID=UPI003D9146E0